MIRILVADDHTLLGNALAELLDRERDFEVVALAADAYETLLLAAEHRPHVVLLDVRMPGNERPHDTVRQLHRMTPEVRVLILTMHDDPALVRSMVALGVSGFLHKSVTREALVAAVRGACSANSALTVSLSAGGPHPHLAGESGPLSPREVEVLQLVATGLSNYQIARRLTIVEGTVKRHMRGIFGKLAVRSRVQAVNKAVHLGLISLPPPAQGPHPVQVPMPKPPPTGRIAPVT